MSYSDEEREQVRARLWAHRDWELLFLEEVASTQDVVKEWAESRREFGNEPEKLIAIASHQTQGRGRRGHHWNQEPGTGISFSALLRPGERYPGLLLPILVAAATWSALRVRLGDELRIKWPNDVLIGGRKLCGVLIENGQPGSWVVGVGVNVNTRAFPDELEPRATSMLRELGAEQPRAEVLGEILETLAGLVASAEHGDIEISSRLFLEGMGLENEAVVVTTAAGEFFGRLRRVTPDGVSLDSRRFELGEVDLIRAAR